MLAALLMRFLNFCQHNLQKKKKTRKQEIMANSGGFRRPWFKKQPQINPKLVSAAVNFDNEPKFGYDGFKIVLSRREYARFNVMNSSVIDFFR
jgi:hypothetical protein